MKISCLPCSLFAEIEQNRMSLCDWVAVAEDIGYDGFDISIIMLKNHTPAYLSEIKSMLKGAKIPPLMVTTYPDFTHPLEEQRKREMVYLKNDIALAGELGFPYLRVVAGQAHPEVKRADGITTAVENMRTADEYARDAGVMLLYENHAKPKAWNYYDFSYPLDIFYEICTGIADTGIRLNFDIGNVVSLGEDPLAVLEKIGDKIETIHISDIAAPGRFEPVAIGTGASPIWKVLETLRRRGFDGWLSIEESSGNGIEGIRTAYKYVKETLSNMS